MSVRVIIHVLGHTLHLLPPPPNSVEFSSLSVLSHRLGDVRWKLHVTDTAGKEYWLTADASKFFASSLCVRWYSIQLPSLTRLKTLQVFAFLPIFYHRNWTPHINRLACLALSSNYFGDCSVEYNCN